MGQTVNIIISLTEPSIVHVVITDRTSRWVQNIYDAQLSIASQTCEQWLILWTKCVSVVSICMQLHVQCDVTITIGVTTLWDYTLSMNFDTWQHCKLQDTHMVCHDLTCTRQNATHSCISYKCWTHLYSERCNPMCFNVHVVALSDIFMYK